MITGSFEAFDRETRKVVTIDYVVDHERAYLECVARHSGEVVLCCDHAEFTRVDCRRYFTVVS